VARRKPRKPLRKSGTLLVLIGSLKLLKAAALIAIGIGAIHYLHRDLAAAVVHWTQVLGVDPDNRFVHGLLDRIFRVTPKQLKALSIGTFLYAALFATEGIGLLMRKRWAEYFTIVTTTLLIPLEVYEVVHKFTPGKVVVVIVNALIVWYLVLRVRAER